MSARDELAKVIVSHPWLQDFEGLYTGRCPECGRKIHGGSNSPSHANHLAEAVLAAGYRKPRTITDHYAKDGTHALKVGSVILSHGEALLAMSGGVFADPTDSTWDYWELELPITVIYEPEDGPTLDASHSNPRIIKTPEELDILPVGAVVLSEPYTHHENGVRISFQRWDDGQWHRGARAGSTHPDNFLPVTVLFDPAVQL